MPRLQLFDLGGQLTDDRTNPAEVQGLLQAMGVAADRWQLRRTPLSATPLLTYARELCHLERRFGTVRTDLARLRPAAADSPPWIESVDEHVHDDVEVRVVLLGHLLYRFRIPTRAGWAALWLGPGDWVALPAGVAHSVDAGPRPQVDLLRLSGAGEGWLPRPTHASTPDWLPRMASPVGAALQRKAA